MSGAQRRLALPAAQRSGLWLVLLLPGALVLFLGLDGGGFFAGTTALAAAVVLGALVLRLTLADRPLEGVGLPLVVAAAALGLFAVWTLLSAAWSDAPARALLEFDRALLYLGALVLLGSVRFTPARLRLCLRGVLAATVALCAIGLISRMLPEVISAEANVANERLSHPLTYWNALGLLAALGMVLALGVSSDSDEPRTGRVLAAAALPALAATLLLTFSRGAIVAGAVALVAYAIVGRPRSLLSGLAASAPPTAVAVVATLGADLLGTREPTTPAAVAQGEDAALVVGLCVIAAALLRALLLPLDRKLDGVRVSVRMRRSILGAAAATAVVVAVALAVAVDAPGELSEQYERFTSGDALATTTSRDRLLNPANNGRLEFWRVGLDAWGRDPAAGQGAGTYPTIWTRERPRLIPGTDGHSLYAEVLAELGVVGLALLAVALVVLLGRSAWLCRGAGRPLFAVVLAAALAWALHAGVDWDWEMPAVTLPVFALGGLVLASPARGGRLPGRLPRVAGALLVAVLAVTPVGIVFSQSRLDAAVRELREGDCQAATRSALGSLSALQVRPEPFEVLAYCDAGSPGLDRLAIRMMNEAIRRDPHNWELHYGLALVSGAAGLDPRPAARTALRLDPQGRRARDLERALRTSEPSLWRSRARTAPLPLGGG